ncbi:hypothetical protein BH11ARM2_BH11ARM2_19870 [soil metagenome]
MKSMKYSKMSLVIAGLLCAAVSSMVAGCGQDKPPAVVQASQTQVDNTVQMRQLFVKAKGNYDSLTPEDKATYNTLAGGDAAGQEQWKTMSKNPVGGGTTYSAGDPRANMGGTPGAGQ